MDHIQELRQKGYTVIRGLLSRDEAQNYIDILEERSAIRQQKSGQLGKRGLSESWSQPDGVTQTPEFWPIITNPKLLTMVRQVLGSDDIRYLQHNDLHVGFSAISWHRDSVNRQFGVGPDWDETQAPYRVVRVGIYLQTFAQSQFKLGFIPGSHRAQAKVSLTRKFSEAKLKWLGAMSYLFTNLQMRAANADWIATEPGDCIIFDPRTIHSGSYITGPKYSAFVAYGVENHHFYNHWNYYRNVRSELGYKEIPAELATMLEEHNLLPSQEATAQTVEGAWVPTPILRKQLANRFKM